MSTPIWEEGRVAACLCASCCDRCERRGRCVQLARDVGPPAWALFTLCLPCFTELVYKAGQVIGQLEVGINGKFALR